MACFVYSVTDRESYCFMPDLRKETRSLTVEILAMIMSGIESSEESGREGRFREAAVRLVSLKELLLRGYQGNGVSYQEFRKVREYCMELRDRLLDPVWAEIGDGTGRIFENSLRRMGPRTGQV